MSRSPVGAFAEVACQGPITHTIFDFEQCVPHLGAQIDTASDSVYFAQIEVKMSLKLTAKKLYLLDFCELVRLANGSSKTASQYEVETARSVMFASETVLTSEHKTSSQCQLKPSSEAQNASDAHSPCTAFEPAQHGQPVRALSGCDNREDQGQLPEDVLRSVGQPAHCLWRGDWGRNSRM